MNDAAPNPSGNAQVGHAALAGVDLVIFDFDGVVVDSEVISLSTLQSAFAKYGIAMTVDQVRDRFLGRSMVAVMEAVEAGATQGDTAEFPVVWERALFDRFRAELELLPFVNTFLDYLVMSEKRYCIASSGSVERIEVALKATSTMGRFAHVFSADFVPRGKPDPDLFLFAANQMEIPPDRCLVIEDSPSGVIAAQRAKMRCAGFVGGSHLDDMREQHREELTRLGADYVISRFADLLPGKFDSSTRA